MSFPASLSKLNPHPSSIFSTSFNIFYIYLCNNGLHKRHFTTHQLRPKQQDNAMLCNSSLHRHFFVVFFHSYSRWFTNHPRRRRSRRHPASSQPNTSATAVISSQGLDLSILKTLSTFVYSSAHRGAPVPARVAMEENDEKT